MFTDDLDESKDAEMPDIEMRGRYIAAAQVSLLGAARAAHALDDDFFNYLIQMALAHLLTLEAKATVN